MIVHRLYYHPMRWLVDAIYLFVAVMLAPVVIYRAITTGKYRRDWPERRGFVPDLPPTESRVWIHAVSVGEVNAIRGLVAAWQKQIPNIEIVISTTTDTGIDRARQIFKDLPVIRYPLDFSLFVDRALNHIKPTLIVLVELEVWYQFVTRATGRGIPVVVVNGRLSERSVRRFRWVRPFVRRMFSPITWIGAQDEDYAERFRLMGVPRDRVTITGSLKWDTAEVADTIPGSDALAKAMGIDLGRPLWVCGSTGPGEEEVILKAFKELRRNDPGLQLVLVPRKPERFDEVADLIRQMNFSCVRRTECPDGKERHPGEGEIFLGDTMGELRKFYSLASVVLVGRSFARMGGSDMMEVAALAKPVVVGPHNENFADAIGQLERGGGIRIVPVELDDADVVPRLAQMVGKLLSDPQAACALAQAGREVVLKNRGAMMRTLTRLMEIMQYAQHRSS